ncbi:MAG: monovalent cation/H(+) antiporter subunit G [Chitinophagaceae bacterium]|nr:monovalent cation/H(+) antiporter subunit G [Chitinophagaceae bacterium]MCW5928022.1 monovalent cation/H(+) antiporter subunit G [Chitinophagaceae bacterium]
MTDITIMVLSTIGALSILFAAIGILRMPDFYLRLSVTVKAATLGSGLLLLSAAVFFPEAYVTTKVFAIIFFLVLTAPVAAHMIGRVAYLINARRWDGTVLDELEGMYDKENKVLLSDAEAAKTREDKAADDQAG